MWNNSTEGGIMYLIAIPKGVLPTILTYQDEVEAKAVFKSLRILGYCATMGKIIMCGASQGEVKWDSPKFPE